MEAEPDASDSPIHLPPCGLAAPAILRPGDDDDGDVADRSREHPAEASEGLISECGGWAKEGGDATTHRLICFIHPVSGCYLPGVLSLPDDPPPRLPQACPSALVALAGSEVQEAQKWGAAPEEFDLRGAHRFLM